MPALTKPENNIAVGTKRPKIKELLTELDTAVAGATDYYERCARAYNTRFCIWDGQSDDGKKWAENFGSEVFPWDGASDTRVRTVDSIVNYQVRIMKALAMRGRIQARGTEYDDWSETPIAGTLLNWQLRTHMQSEIRREMELAANWRQLYGASALGTFWERETRLELKQISLQDLKQQAMQEQNRDVLKMIGYIMDPMQEPNLAEMLVRLAPILTIAEAGRVIRELRTTGQSEFPQAYIFKNRPVVRALKLFTHLFFPRSTGHLKRAPWQAVREWYSETELSDKVTTEGWDSAWVDQALSHKGKSCRDDLQDFVRSSGQASKICMVDDYKDMVEVFCFYYQAMYRGVPVMYRTVCHRMVKNKAAFHDFAPYQHGEYPTKELVYQWADHESILDCEGVGGVAMTYQQEIKRQRDYRGDRSSLAIQPALRVPSYRGRMNVLIAPKKNIPERKQGEVGYFDPPPYDPGTIEVERSTRRDLDEYFGIPGEGADPTIVYLAQQDLSDDWGTELSAVFMQMHQLMQQYMSEEEVSRVVGNVQRRPYHVSREEIQGKYDIRIEFDVRDLNMEYLQQKLGLIKEALSLDTVGAFDRVGTIHDIVSWMDPAMAQRRLRDMGEITQTEIDDEQTAFAKMYAGIEPPMREGSQNYQLRLQTLMNLVNANPEIQQDLQRRPIFKALVENRTEFLKFQIMQQQNAQTGRNGVKQVLAPPMQLGQMMGAM